MVGQQQQVGTHCLACRQKESADFPLRRTPITTCACVLARSTSSSSLLWQSWSCALLSISSCWSVRINSSVLLSIIVVWIVGVKVQRNIVKCVILHKMPYLKCVILHKTPYLKCVILHKTHFRQKNIGGIMQMDSSLFALHLTFIEKCIFYLVLYIEKCIFSATFYIEKCNSHKKRTHQQGIYEPVFK